MLFIYYLPATAGCENILSWQAKAISALPGNFAGARLFREKKKTLRRQNNSRDIASSCWLPRFG
ncbi:hypothetical protein ACA373_07235 [Erwinia sp. STN24]|uniref:hypothetical protein n=1 Tax=Erwinia sp. STN24 TaxID=3233996 RepID=UPI0035212985